jgi:hypothetical protein
MNNGQEKGVSFSELMTDKSDQYKLNPFKELFKWIRGNSVHTLPAIALAIMERVPLRDPKKYIQLGEKLKQEISAVLGGCWLN